MSTHYPSPRQQSKLAALQRRADAIARERARCASDAHVAELLWFLRMRLGARGNLPSCALEVLWTRPLDVPRLIRWDHLTGEVTSKEVELP